MASSLPKCRWGVMRIKLEDVPAHRLQEDFTMLCDVILLKTTNQTKRDPKREDVAKAL